MTPQQAYGASVSPIVYARRVLWARLVAVHAYLVACDRRDAAWNVWQSWKAWYQTRFLS